MTLYWSSRQFFSTVDTSNPKLWTIHTLGPYAWDAFHPFTPHYATASLHKKVFYATSGCCCGVNEN